MQGGPGVRLGIELRRAVWMIDVYMPPMSAPCWVRKKRELRRYIRERFKQMSSQSVEKGRVQARISRGGGTDPSNARSCWHARTTRCPGLELEIILRIR